MLIKEETADVETLTGPMRLHIVRPKDDSRCWPGLVLWSEIFQITGPVRRSAQVFAGHGFVVVMPEVYHEALDPGVALSYTPEDTAKGNELKSKKSLAALDDDARASVAFLKSYAGCTGSIGTVGFCLGGGLAFRNCVTCPDVRAGVCWYATDLHKGGLSAQGDDSLARAADIRGELLMIYGRQDPHVPPEGRVIVYTALSAAKVPFQWLEVDGAHAFMRDESSFGRFDPALAMSTYGLAVSMLQRVLGGGSLPK